jgi:hypothetical protein
MYVLHQCECNIVEFFSGFEFVGMLSFLLGRVSVSYICLWKLLLYAFEGKMYRFLQTLSRTTKVLNNSHGDISSGELRVATNAVSIMVLETKNLIFTAHIAVADLLLKPKITDFKLVSFLCDFTVKIVHDLANNVSAIIFLECQLLLYVPFYTLSVDFSFLLL